MTTVRPPSAAGLFYPDEPHALRAEVDRLLREARSLDGCAPHAMIQPHAGYQFSGAVAATGYRLVRHTRPDVRRVVILGPNHTVPLDSIAVTAADEWETPLGTVPIDDVLRDVVAGLPVVETDDRPHATEHAIEVQLPFLQRVLDPGWTLLPMVVGDCKPAATAEVIDACADPETLVVVSSDLSHYHSYGEARRIDSITVEEIVARTVAAIGPRQACGYSPIRGLLTAQLVEQLRVDILDVRNSGDTAGPNHRVVGYASIAFC